MKKEHKDALLALINRQIGKKDNAPRLFNQLLLDEAAGSGPRPEAELVVLVFPTAEIKKANNSETKLAIARTLIATDKTSVVRRTMAQLRAVFANVAASPEGRRLPVEIDFSDIPYGIVLRDRDVLVRKFWEPYISTKDSRELLMVYPENVFFRSLRERFFVRHLDVNERLKNPEFSFLKESKPNEPREPLHYARHFVSSGDVSALLFLTRWFERIGILTDHSVAHQSSKQYLVNKNLIIFGNKRTYPLVHQLIEDGHFCFQIEDDCIVNRHPIESDPKSDSKAKVVAKARLSSKENQNGPQWDHFYRDNFGSPGKVRGLLSRRFDTKFKGWITIITSNSGRFHEAIAYCLTQESEMRELLRWLNDSDDDLPVPTQFEALLDVEVDEGEETPRPTYTIIPLAKRKGEPK